MGTGGGKRMKNSYKKINISLSNIFAQAMADDLKKIKEERTEKTYIIGGEKRRLVKKNGVYTSEKVNKNEVKQ